MLIIEHCNLCELMTPLPQQILSGNLHLVTLVLPVPMLLLLLRKSCDMQV